MDSDGSESGHVNPITTCPHVHNFVKPVNTLDTAAPCFGCTETKENWVCLTCFTVGCSRFQKKHALQHYEESKHPIIMSYSDLNMWCYECESYIKNPVLSAPYQLAYKDKFQSGKDNTFIISPSNTSGEEIKEFYDDPKELEAKVMELANIIRNANYLVAFTGAGISTSSKIPDYRGPQGVWTLQERGVRPHFEVTIEQALPTIGHMALLQLHKAGILKFLVSTNVDGLHRRSGIPKDSMSELHGNCYLEKCPNCKKDFLRTFDASSGRSDHVTGRKCDGCNTPLLDSIINFGENLPIDELEKTVFHTGKADVSLVLGTSMRVSPANKFPVEVVTENGGKMIIVNLQKTPYDKKASLRIFEKTDLVLQMLFKELNMEIPSYVPEHDGIKGNRME